MKKHPPYDTALCHNKVGAEKCKTCLRNADRYEPVGYAHTAFILNKEQRESAENGDCPLYWEDKQ